MKKYFAFILIGVALALPSLAEAARCCITVTAPCKALTSGRASGNVCDPASNTILACTLASSICPSSGANCCVAVTGCTAKSDTAACASGSVDVDCAGEKLCPQSASTTTAPAQPFVPIAPRLSVNIPTLNTQDFLNVKSEGGYVYVPFIAVYVAAAYKYGVGVAAVLAVIMIMVGGFRWIASGGGPEVDAAKKMIASAIIGLFIAVGSYTVLQVINPDLVQFRSLRLQVATPLNDDMVYDKNSENTTFSSNLTKTELDNVFKAYASCHGMDWRVLKGIAAAESGLDPSIFNGKHQGLFQETEAYCGSGIGNYPFLSCSNRFDAEANTAAAAFHISSQLQEINNRCPGSLLSDQMLLLYVAHNNGPAVMNYVLAAGACDANSQGAVVRRFYETCGGKNPPPADCNGTFRTVTADQGFKKWQFGQRVVNNVQALGATEAFPPEARSNASCPSITGKRVNS